MQGILARALHLGLRRRGGRGVAFTPPVPIPPVNTVAPVASGTARVGNTLSVTNGTWTNSPTSYTYQWYSGANPISGAASSTYLLVSGDVGANINCTVTATNSDGFNVSTSNTIGPILPALAPPVNTAAPVLTGTPFINYTLACSTGSWTNSPTGYTYQWRRGTTNIAGATVNAYVVTSADYGFALNCLVTATNADGSTAQVSADTANVTADSGGQFTPQSLASIKLDLDASRPAFITKDGANKVSAWSGTLASPKIYTQETAANQPLYVTGTYPYVDFTLANTQWMHCDSFPFTGGLFSFFAVMEHRTVAASSARIFGLSANAETDNTSANGVGVLSRSSTSSSLRANYNSNNTVGIALPYNTKAVMETESDGATLQVFRDAVGGGALSSVVNANAVRSGLGVGGTAAGWGTSYMDGKLYEVMFFTPQLNASDIAKVQGYLAWKWFGASNPLPAGHTYKSAPP
jgi:hypothetical protein